MADEDASLRRTWRGNALEGCRKRAVQAAPHDVPLRVKEAEIMARDPVPAEDDVKAWAQVQRGHVNHLTQGFTVADDEVDAHGRGQRELGPWRRHANRRRTWCGRRRKVEKASEGSTDEAVCGAGVQHNEDSSEPLWRPDKTRHNGLEGRVATEPRCERRLLRMESPG